MWGNTLKNMTDWLKWQNRRKPKWKQTCWEVVGATDVVHSFWFLFEVVVCPYWYCVVLLFIRFSWRNVSDNKNFATREGLTSDVISGCHVGQPPETARNIRTHASCQFHIKYSKGNDKENRGGGKETDHKKGEVPEKAARNLWDIFPVCCRDRLQHLWRTSFERSWPGWKKRASVTFTRTLVELWPALLSQFAALFVVSLMI